MVIFAPQQYALGCGLACISYLVDMSQEDLLIQNPDILSVQKLQFIGLFAPEIVSLLGRYGKAYDWKDGSTEQGEPPNGSIVYIDQINHYMVKIGYRWADPHMHLRGYPAFGWRDNLPYSPSCCIMPSSK